MWGLIQIADMLRVARRSLLFCILLQMALMAPAVADIIYFLDGSVTVCRDKAWEDDGKIRCEFYGTVVEYPKADVERVISGVDEIPDIIEAEEGKEQPRTGIGPKAPPLQTAPAPQPAVLEMDRSGGPLFYDPRRPKKYWVSETSRHDSLKAALNAFSQQYQQTPEWIKARMGGSNILSIIHRNLADKQPLPENQPTLKQPAVEKPVSPGIDIKKLSGVPFYDPRRPQKFWATETSRHAVLGKALDALVQHYGQTLEWVKSHMGNTNDLGEIHQNLSRALAGNGS